MAVQIVKINNKNGNRSCNENDEILKMKFISFFSDKNENEIECDNRTVKRRLFMVLLKRPTTYFTRERERKEIVAVLLFGLIQLGLFSIQFKWEREEARGLSFFFGMCPMIK